MAQDIMNGSGNPQNPAAPKPAPQPQSIPAPQTASVPTKQSVPQPQSIPAPQTASVPTKQSVPADEETETEDIEQSKPGILGIRVNEDKASTGDGGSKKGESAKISSETSWLYDRYQSVSTQRNIMLLLNILGLVCIVVSVVASSRIAKNKSLDPFVIEIDKKSGIVTLVDQDKIKLFTPDEAVNSYFVIQYLRARELFDPRNYKAIYYKGVRLMSDEKVYKNFLRMLRVDNKNNPMSAYANNVSCTLVVRSLQYLQPTSVQVRFTVEAEISAGKVVTRNRIAVLGFKYAPLKLTEEDRYINPLGFTVTSYSSSDEVL